MFFSRLVTGRYGYDAGEERTHPALATAPAQGWFSRLIAAIFPRKRAN